MSSDSAKDLAARIDKLHTKATPGPWYAERGGNLCSGDRGDIVTIGSLDSSNDDALVLELRNSWTRISAALRSLPAWPPELLVEIMRNLNERSECPFCGIEDGDHIEGELCARLDALINRPNASRTE